MITEQDDLFAKKTDMRGETTKKPDGVCADSMAQRRRIKAEVVFEPVNAGVRVTARDSDQRLLWGYIGSKETTNQKHCTVAIYETLQALLVDELKKCQLMDSKSKDPTATALAALDQLEKTTRWLRGSLTVKKTTEASLERASLIAGIAADADLQIRHATEGLRGMKSPKDTEPPSVLT